MNKKNQHIPVKEAFAGWRKDPELTLESNAFKDEFTNPSAPINTTSDQRLMHSPPKVCDNTPEEDAEIQRQIAEDPELAEIPQHAQMIKTGHPFS